MRFVLVAMILFSTVAISENKIPSSFESNYLALQKKIDELKEKGRKVDEQTRKEMDDLMAQMNHEHAELKRELEKRNTQLKQAANEAKDAKEDWVKRFKAAYGEISGGATRAWDKLKNGSDTN